MSLNIALPAEPENRVRDYVASGLYGSASEVIREAPRLFDAYQTVQVASFASLKADVAQGVADVHSGDSFPLSVSSPDGCFHAIRSRPLQTRQLHPCEFMPMIFRSSAQCENCLVMPIFFAITPQVARVISRQR